MRILRNLWTSEPLAEVEDQTLVEAEHILVQARQAFDRGVLESLELREGALRRFHTLLAENRESLLHLAIGEGGKPYADTMVELDRALLGVDLCLEHLKHPLDRAVRLGNPSALQQHKAWTIREGIGPVLAYSAFNHPVNLFIHQVLPALAMGCPVVFKPSEKTPLVAARLVQLCHEAGFPTTSIQLLLCSNEVAERIAQHPDIALFSFIGAAHIGWRLRSQLAPGVRCVLEHGGMAPCILDADADIEAILPGLVRAATYHAGQVCISTQRIYVRTALYERFLGKFQQALAALRRGSPFDPATQLGLLCSYEAVERYHALLDEARASGAEVWTGPDLEHPLAVPAATVVGGGSCRLYREEAFGPVVTVHTYDDPDAVARELEALPYAFQASIFSAQMENAMAWVRRLRFATVLVNEHTVFRTDDMPFGGWKSSGLGVGGIAGTMEACSREKLVIVKA